MNIDKFEDINWIVVPGGPGLSKEYLKYGLSDAFFNFKLNYYNQLGSPESKCDKIPTIEAIVKELTNFATERFIKFGIICHSFGSYLSIRAIENGLDKNLVAMIMLSPMPLEYSQWIESLKAIKSKIPTEKLLEIQSSEKAGMLDSEIFLLYYPYYTAHQTTCPIKILFDSKMCNNISAQVKNFCDYQLLDSVNIPVIAIVGEDDEFYKRSTFNFEKIVLPSVGHYPFFENKSLFKSIVQQLRDHTI
ncbi:MAG: hypothetical protein KBD37_05775 [Burkholderiales bacterium]|nr:hypothetical protein [Burkholderiales bacterium]